MTVYVVIRVDFYSLSSEHPESIRAVEVLPTFEEATREVERLNALKGTDKHRYVVSASHWYPDGRGVET